MKTIWKFKLSFQDNQTIEMPSKAEILTVQMQGADLQLWALVDTLNPKEERFIEVIGTGHPISGTDNRKYISSIQVEQGQLIFHVFEYLGI